jgi:hypothetical protein
MRIAIIIGVVVGFVAMLCAIVVLTLAGKDTSVFIGFATSAGVFLIPQLLTLLKAHQAATDVAIVKEQTNGPLTKMSEQVQQLTDETKKANGGNNAGSV